MRISDWSSDVCSSDLTLLFGTISLSINGSLYKQLPYDPLRDLVPVSQLSSAPFLLVVNPATPIHSVADLIQTAKQAQQGYAPDYASAGKSEERREGKA